ncbi:hypothetical protein ElyMa_005881900 [Elysia marginata]|uniref:Uncharacterized protein n=1 Tax=Elysia marginata TaxID=1093978 RepID=A0AAV4G2H4_9GAST|nr:hypothetical protein ElyMa_005881900 [Elysia marginata]
MEEQFNDGSSGIEKKNDKRSQKTAQSQCREARQAVSLEVSLWHDQGKRHEEKSALSLATRMKRTARKHTDMKRFRPFTTLSMKVYPGCQTRRDWERWVGNLGETRPSLGFGGPISLDEAGGRGRRVAQSILLSGRG